MSAGHIERGVILAPQLFRPKPYDIDFTGFLSNTVALRWMEDMRVAMMRNTFSYFAHEQSENLSVIVEAHVNYTKPVRYNDSLLGYLRVTLVSAVKWRIDFSFCFEDGESEALSAYQIGVFIDAKSYRALKIPGKLVDAIKKFGEAELREPQRQWARSEVL